MEKDYIKIYLDTYQQTEIEAEKEIKEKFIDFKRKGKNHQFSANKIITEFNSEEENSIVKQKPFDELFYTYKNRLDEYALDTQMNVIEEKLLPMFKKVNSTQFEDFEDYIINLATVNSRFNIFNQFSNKRAFYDLLFQLNDFKDFKIKDFDCRHNTDIYEKYRKLLHEPQINKLQDSYENRATSKEENIELPIYYKFKPEFSDNFLTKDCYDILCKNFINEKQMTFEDFVQFFSQKNSNPKIELHFWCESYIASFLISKLVKEVYQSVTLKEFMQKYIFSKEGTRMNDNYISSSKRDIQESDELKVKNSLKLIKN